eukprot:3761937-Rhodomonas_salina.1
MMHHHSPLFCRAEMRPLRLRHTSLPAEMRPLRGTIQRLGAALVNGNLAKGGARKGDASGSSSLISRPEADDRWTSWAGS